MLVVRGGTIVTMDASRRIVPNGSLVIDGEVIKDVLEPGQPIPENVRKTVDATGRIVLPGLTNMHCSPARTVFRYSKSGRGEYPGEVESTERFGKTSFTKDEMLYSSLAGIIEQIRSGVSTIFVLHVPFNDVRSETATLTNAVSLTGIRACLSPALRDLSEDGKPASMLKQTESFIRWCIRERVPNLRTMVGLERSSVCSDDLLEAAADLVDRLKIGIHAAVAPTREDAQDCMSRNNLRVVQRLHDFGLLNRETIAAHAAYVDENELEILRNSECLVVHTPTSDLLTARTVAPIAGMLKRGLRMAVGSWDQGTSPLFEACISRLAIPAWTSERAKCGLEGLLKMVFSEGPRFAGGVFGFRMGSLEAGAVADVATFPAVLTRPVEDWDWAEQILQGIGSQCAADNLIVGGKTIMENGIIQTVVEEEILAKVGEINLNE